MIRTPLSDDLPRSRTLSVVLLLILFGLAAAPFVFPGTRSLNVAAKIAVFRIVQEALNNVLKHSEAKHVGIQLDFADKGMRATVRDDGCGFDLQKIRVAQSSSRPSLWLAGMQERAALLGGMVSIESRP